MNDAFYPGREPGEIRRPNTRSVKPDPTDPRLGVPPDKFAAFAQDVSDEKRQAVMFFLFPPEGLRDAPLDVIRQVIANSAASLLETIALEIYKSYTSDPPDAAAARNLAEMVARHADSLRKG